MAAQEVLDYYVKKEWSGAIPYAVQSYVMANIVKYFYIKQTAPKVARIKSRCFGGSFTLCGGWAGRCRP